MKKKVSLIAGLVLLGLLLWYLFIKPYDYLVSFKTKAIPGTINQTVKLWSKSVDASSQITQQDLRNLSQKFKIKDSTYQYDWKIQALDDSTTQVKVYVKDLNNSIHNKISIPFSKTNFEKTTERTLLDFNRKLIEHLNNFKVSISGNATSPETYCAYIPIKSTQFQKAKGMMLNYSLISNFIVENKIQLNGRPMVEIVKWDIDTDSIHYNFCYPIVKTDSLPEDRLIKYKKLAAQPSLMAVYNGNYITSDRAWYALQDYAQKNNISILSKPIEVFYNNPNMGGNEKEWKTEVYMPIQ